MTTTLPESAVAVCAYDDLVPNLGVAALVGDTQVALFRLDDDSLHAVQNVCPFSGAAVMSRGITGDRGDEPTISSPIYKQIFSLETGQCLVTMDKEPVLDSPDLAVYQVSVDNGQVIINLAGGQ